MTVLAEVSAQVRTWARAPPEISTYWLSSGLVREPSGSYRRPVLREMRVAERLRRDRSPTR